MKPPLPNSKTIPWARTPWRLCTLEGKPPKPRWLELQWKRAAGQKPSLSFGPCNFRQDTPGPPGVAQSHPTYDSHKWPGTGGLLGPAPRRRVLLRRCDHHAGNFPAGAGRSRGLPGPAPATQDTHLHRASKSTAWACAEPAAATSSSSSRRGGRRATRGPEGTGPGRTPRIACGVGLTAAGRSVPRLGHGRAAATAESKLQGELEGEKRRERAGARGE